MTGPELTGGQGAGGVAPCAALEAWVWSMAGGAPRVTFGGMPPRGNREWRIAVWRAIAAEAARRAAEEEAGHPLPPRPAERPG